MLVDTTRSRSQIKHSQKKSTSRCRRIMVRGGYRLGETPRACWFATTMANGYSARRMAELDLFRSQLGAPWEACQVADGNLIRRRILRRGKLQNWATSVLPALPALQTKPTLPSSHESKTIGRVVSFVRQRHEIFSTTAQHQIWTNHKNCI